MRAVAAEKVTLLIIIVGNQRVALTFSKYIQVSSVVHGFLYEDGMCKLVGIHGPKLGGDSEGMNWTDQCSQNLESWRGIPRVKMPFPVYRRALFYPGKGGGNEPVRRVLIEKSYIREWAGKTFALILPLPLLKSRFLLPK